MEYKVTAGQLYIGMTKSYEQALEWAANHDRLVRNGPYATITEVE